MRYIFCAYETLCKCAAQTSDVLPLLYGNKLTVLRQKQAVPLTASKCLVMSIMSSQSPTKAPMVRNKAKAVHKVLKEDDFRRATEASWTKHSSEVQSLDILTRCKKLNQFLAQGLLGDVEEEVLQTLNQPASASRPAAVQRALAQTLQKQPQSSRTPAAQVMNEKQPPVQQQSYSSAAAGSPTRRPLTSRITAKESAALLELLEDERSQQRRATNNGGSSSSDHDGATSVATVCDRAAVPATEAQHAKTREPATAAADDELDIISLINQPIAADSAQAVREPDAAAHHFRSVLRQLHRQQEEQAAICLQQAYRCRHACGQLQELRQQASQLVLQQQAQLQGHQPGLQQQQELVQEQRSSTSSNQQAGVATAWDGYYKYWGPHAASVMQRHWRCYVTRKRYKHQKQAAVVLQAYIRGWQYRQSPENPVLAHRQQMQEQERKQRQAAALILQCCVRVWNACRQYQQLLQNAAVTTAAGAGAVAGLSDSPAELCAEADASQETSAVESVEQVMPAIPNDGGNTSSRHITRPGSDRSTSSRCSRDSSDQVRTSQQAASTNKPHMQKQRKQKNKSNHVMVQSAEHIHGNDQQVVAQQRHQQPQMQRAQEPHKEQQLHGRVSRIANSRDSDTHSREAASGGPITDADALMARQLVIRSAADTRTAMQHASSENGAVTGGLAGELVQRAEELSVGEGLQQAHLAARTTMAGSSFRGLQEAMVVVKGRSDKH